MVTFRGTDGKEQFRVEENLEEAVRLVEQIRNGGEISELHLWEVNEIPLEFRAYYRVELGHEPPVEAPAARFDTMDMQTTILPPEPAPDAPPDIVAPDPVVVSAEGRTDAPSFGIFSR